MRWSCATVAVVSAAVPPRERQQARFATSRLWSQRAECRRERKENHCKIDDEGGGGRKQSQPPSRTSAGTLPDKLETLALYVNVFQQRYDEGLLFCHP